MKTQKKKVLIDIDFVLRDWVQALTNNYISKVGDFEGEIADLDKIWESFPFPQYIELEKPTDDPDITERTMAVDEKSEWKFNKGYFNKFVLDNVLEIFGHANEAVPNAVAHLNKLQAENPDWEITLFSTSKGKAIPATYFFLSKSGCEIKNVKFINGWLDVDLEHQTGIVQYWDAVVSANSDYHVVTRGRFYYVDSQFNIKYKGDNLFDPCRINSIKDILTFTSPEN